MFKSAVPPFAAFALAVLLTAPAAAQPSVSEVTVRAHPHPNVEVRSKAVSYRDLDMKTIEGAETLLGRIRRAAEVVCSPAPAMKSIREFQDYERCRAEAIQGAVAQTKSPELSALYSRVG